MAPGAGGALKPTIFRLGMLPSLCDYCPIVSDRAASSHAIVPRRARPFKSSATIGAAAKLNSICVSIILIMPNLWHLPRDSPAISCNSSKFICCDITIFIVWLNLRAAEKWQENKRPLNEQITELFPLFPLDLFYLTLWTGDVTRQGTVGRTTGDRLLQTAGI